MRTIQFRTKIKNGIIEISEKYRNKIRGEVKAILLSEDATEERSFDMIEDLLENPLRLPGFRPCSRKEIYERNK